MTVIGALQLEIDDINYIVNDIKQAVTNNKPVEEKLHVVIVISNPCQYARRYLLAREFIQRIEKEEPNVILYVAELAYSLPGQKPQGFHVTEAGNPRHLQMRTSSPPLWVKENLINIAFKKLLPKGWKAAAWIDADIEFDSSSWALDTLKILNGTRDVVQLFSHALDMNANLDSMSIFSGFGYQYTHHRAYTRKGGVQYFHPGFAWAITREAYERMGGLYQMGILGAGDHNTALSIIGHGDKSLNGDVTEDFMNSIMDFQKKVFGLRLGYVPGIIRHHFHGPKKDRKYGERWKVLNKHEYKPSVHITTNSDGLLVPTKECPQELLDEIFQYFAERNEDDGFKEAQEAMDALAISKKNKQVHVDVFGNK